MSERVDQRLELDHRVALVGIDHRSAEAEGLMGDVVAKLVGVYTVEGLGRPDESRGDVVDECSDCCVQDLR